MFRNFKLADTVVIVLLLCLSFIPYHFLLHKHDTNNHLIAIVKVNNHQVKELSLNRDTVYTYDRSNRQNILVVKNHRIHMASANCRDQVCVKEGWKNKAGQTIICLPHKFLVEIKAASGQKDKDDFDHTLVNP